LHSQIYFTNKKIDINPKLLFTGLKYTICREIISIPCYFSTYHYLNNNYKIDSIFSNSFIFGGVAGMTSWMCTYPIDTLKTRKQLDHSKSFKELYKMGKLFNGLAITLLRAFIVNGFSFHIYDKLKI
jgi:solute carrier family 25 carnitine/acylcarnitine transporter 20/29